MGSAVDETNLTRELQRYQAAGMGGVHIIPIYGAKGYEARFIDYLSPKWMEMLGFTVREARRLGLGVDMTTGSGWCFGGPHVTDEEANASVALKTLAVNSGSNLVEKLDPKTTQAVVAFSSKRECVELTSRIQSDGQVNWSPATGSWQVYVVSQRPSGQRVKRAGPGGQGYMLNLIYPAAMRHYLEWFDDAFRGYRDPKPRALYHDSYEYRSDWACDFFAEFEKRRGYRLQTELPALFSNLGRSTADASPVTDRDHVARVKSDYRETVADAMAQESLPLWADWARAHGFLTRNEAHGSPGNWLDLYAVADIPETEMFSKDRNKLVCKFASSAGHVAGKNLIAAETGTWLEEHFTESLADMKYLVDDMFLSGVNHVFYHGTCYSPDNAPWPGWVFYASYEMNPRNSIWRDVPALNMYVARCQAVLQSGRPDNDILLYWPIYDLWHNPAGLVQLLTVHSREWFQDQPMGRAAERLWQRGYAFDYISDRQLAGATQLGGQIQVTGARYRSLVVPQTEHLPPEALRAMLALARAGATVIFAEQLPADVPGWGSLERRRQEFKKLLADLKLVRTDKPGLTQATVGRGRVLVGELEAALTVAGVPREPLFDHPGLMCVRRVSEGGWYYFIANRSEQAVVNDWLPLARPVRSAELMDPLNGRTGGALLRAVAGGGAEVFISLEPGESIIVRGSADQQPEGEPWTFWEPCGTAKTLIEPWQVNFIAGGPELPARVQMPQLVSWTELSDTNSQRFAGTARYSVRFDRPGSAPEHCQLDLGKVCQSAHVRLNGQELGTLITPPFRIVVDALKPKGNLLEIEATNVSANRVRDLDRRGVKWKNFYDINLVNVDYRPFDASKWPLTESGLLGPVTLTPVAPMKLAGRSHD
jgi:hypothetical protein